jgi:hypothetical protein
MRLMFDLYGIKTKQNLEDLIENNENFPDLEKLIEQ